MQGRNFDLKLCPSCKAYQDANKKECPNCGYDLTNVGIIRGGGVMNQLTVGGIISNAFSLGLKNLIPIMGAVILWVLTIWIPYINVGTTIGLFGLVVAMSKGTVISPVEIFDSRYRRLMGEFFLLMSFITLGTLIGYLFFIIPGIVISISWGQSLYLLLDKNMGPIESITTSNKITYGKKWTIFCGVLVVALIADIALIVVAAVLGQISEILAVIFVIIAYVALVSIFLGASAYIYDVLSKDVV